MGSSCRFVVLCALALFHMCEATISDKRLCGDPSCSEPVSLAKTLIFYSSVDPRILSFAKDVDCEIYSKSAGSRPDLWGAKIKERRGYVPSGLVREYKVLKTSLHFVVSTEGSENVSDSSVERDTDESLKNVSNSMNIHKTSNLEAALDDVEHSGLEPDPGSGIQTATPSLDSSVINLPFADVGHQSFSGSGVSAEQIESDKSPNFEVTRQAFEVVDGTTLYCETDGKTESNLCLPQVQPTFTTLSSLPSVVPKKKSEPQNEPISVPPSEVNEPLTSTESAGVDSTESVALEGQLLENKEGGTFEKEDQESDEKKVESVSVVGKKETDPVTGKEVTSVEEHEQQTENVSYIDEPKSETETGVIEDKEEIIEKRHKAPDRESQGIEEDEVDEEDEENDDDEDEDDEDIEEEVEELPVRGTNAEKLVEVESVNTVDGPTKPGRSDALQVGDQGTEQPTLETDANISSVFTNNSKADGLNLQENAEVSLVQAELPESITDRYTPSKEEVATRESSTLEHAVLQAAERQSAYGNADQTESSVGNFEELEGLQVRKVQENVTEGEGSGIIEQVETQVGADTLDHLQSLAGDDKAVEGEEVIDSSKVMKSIHGSDDPEYTSESLKTQYENGYPQHVFDNVADYNSDLSSELKDEIKSSLAEESDTDSIQGEVETTTAASSEEYYEPLVYGPSAEETSTAVSTSTLEELLVLAQGSDLVSDEPSGGLLSGITDTLSAGIGVLTSMLGGSSPVADVPELNESNQDMVTERSPNTDKAADTNMKRDAGWSSQWGDPDRGHIVTGYGKDNLNEEKERMSAACKVNYNPSAGTGSDCSDVFGDLPSIQQNTEEEPVVPKKAVTVEFVEDDNLTMDLQRSSYETSMYLIITAATVLLFSLGHYYIEKRRRDGVLVAKINGLEKELLVSSKECLILKDDLQATKEKLLSVESCSTESSEVVGALNVELEESKVTRAELEEQVAALEKELEVATEAGLELNRMLSEFLSAQHGSDTVMKSVEQLQKQLDSQESTITTMTASLNAKNIENETLQAELTAAKDKMNSLEDDMQKVNENFNDVLSAKLTMEEQFLEKNKLLQTQLNEAEDRMSRDTEQLQREKSTLQEMVNKLKDSILTKESEITVLQDCLRQLKTTSDEDDDKFQALLDAGHAKAELKCMTFERDTLAEKLKDEVDARRLLEDHVHVISEEVTRLRGSYEEAEREKIEAQTRLEVLSNYFKEKETQLQKELGLQEAMCLQKEGDATSTYERIKSLQEEIENYKSQNETLKKEILDQERGLKCQIATLEKKAHENWVAARQAERKLEESKQEASQLRNRLIIVEKNVLNTSKTGETAAMNDRIPGDSNGELPTSPVHMGISAFQDSPSSPLHYQHHDGLPISPPLPTLIPGQHLPPSPFMGMPPPGLFIPPPPPGAPFMPPPPPPLFPGDRRPPPVGRMSSPPPHHYSPPPPPGTRGSFSPYDHSPPPSPPPGRPYRSPPPCDDSPDRFRQHRSPPPPPSHFNPYPPPTSRPPPHRDDSHGFRPLPPPIRRDSPREPKVVLHKGWKKFSKIRQFWSSMEAGGGSTLSSAHSSESLEKSSQHSGRV